MKPVITAMRMLPAVELTVTAERTYGSFVAPHLWVTVMAHAHGGAMVGCVGYGLSPIFDRIYVDGLHIEPEFRCRGYAGSLLRAIVKACSTNGHSIPITALYEVFASSSFWAGLRAGLVPGLTVTQDVRVSEMDAEASRWKAVLIAAS